MKSFAPSLPFSIFLLLLPALSRTADPLEALIRNGWLMIRDYGERVISNIAIPRTSDLPENSGAFQLDPDKRKALDTFSQVLIGHGGQANGRFADDKHVSTWVPGCRVGGCLACHSDQ
uniref:Uncharacterized protein n=1 Tax=Caenorhabditis japonica TaxID=281687 RepID=A0A8R1I513_CAEJA